MSISFVKTEKQQQMVNRLEKLRPVFLAREETLDNLGSFPFENIADLKKIGYPSLPIREHLPLYDFLLYQETIARGDGATALSIGWHVGIMQELVENQQWNPEIYEWIIEEVKNGALLNRAASESNTGSPTRGGLPETKAVLQNDKWTINGRKIFTTMSPALDYFLVSAVMNEQNEIGDFLVPRETEGVSIEETWDSVSMRGTASHDLVLKDVVIAKEYMVENVTAMLKGKPKSTGWMLHIPACYLGIAVAARDYALEFATTYTPNSIGKPISTLPTIKQLLGEIDLKILQARSTLYTVATAYDESVDKMSLRPELGAAKHIVTNLAVEIVDKALRIVGLRGLSEKSPLHRYYLNVRAGIHNPPMDDSVLMLLAEQAIKEREFVKN